jgi:hypothetical protein
MQQKDQTIASIRCGCNVFTIKSGKTLQCALDGQEILTAKLDDQSFFPVVAIMVNSLVKPKSEISIKTAKGMSDFIKPLVDQIEKSDKAKSKLLETKPDEMAENKGIDSKLNKEALDKYQENIKVYAGTYDEALSLSEVLLKTNLPKTMWGAKELKSSITHMRTASVDVINSREKFEIASEHSDVRVGNVSSILFDKRASNKKYVEESITSITNDFESMKNMMASFLINNYNLYNSDQLFKKCAGYPASWFFDPSVFLSFREKFEDIAEHIIEASKTESTVIRPLSKLIKEN